MAMTGVLVRLPDEMIAAIDAKAGAGGRAKWIRGVLEGALRDDPAIGRVVTTEGERAILTARLGALGVERPSAAVDEKRVSKGRSEPKALAAQQKPVSTSSGAEPSFKREDDGVLWRALRVKRGSSREMRDRLGWMEMRVERAVASLLSSGLVRVREGLLEVVHPSR